MSKQFSGTRHRWMLWMASACLLALGLTACGSSSSNNTTSSAAGTTTTPTASSSEADLSKFQSMVDATMKPQTQWQGPTDPVTPPKNINLALVTCAGVVAGCVQPAEEAAKAAKSLGWKTTIYDGKGDPTVQSRVVTQAVNGGATAILLAGVDPTAIQSAMAAAKAKNIPVGSMTQGIAPTGGLSFDIGANYQKAGEVAGAWIVVDSKGKAVVLPTNDKEFKSTLALIDGAIATIKECGGCKLKSTEFFVAQNIGNGLGDRIAQKLRSNPDVNYVIGAFDPAVSDMVPAIQNAGLADKVKIISNVGLEQNLGFIRDGKVQAADIVFDNQYVGYAGIDQMSRVLTKKPLSKSSGETDPRYIYNENVPYGLVTKENVGDPKKPYRAGFDTVARFNQLWGK